MRQLIYIGIKTGNRFTFFYSPEIDKTGVCKRKDEKSVLMNSEIEKIERIFPETVETELKYA